MIDAIKFWLAKGLADIIWAVGLIAIIASIFTVAVAWDMVAEWWNRRQK